MDESEAFWAGLVVSVIMLGSGFSLLFVQAFTGYGAVILSLGVMTMILVLMTKALITQIQKWMDYNARIEETVSTILTLKNQAVQTQPHTAVQTKEAKAEEEKGIAVAAS